MSTLINSPPSSRESLWLCLHFTRLPLDVFVLPDESRATAVVEQRFIHCANRHNLSPGLSLATAHALYADLIALERDVEREREYLHQLAHWAYQFTPGVIIAHRNSLLLEVGSCRRLYKGIRNLLNAIRRSLKKRRQYADFGLAHTPKSAWLLAQCRCAPALEGNLIDEALLEKQLASVPVSVLEIDYQSQDTLEKMGINTLGAIFALPVTALGKRFGEKFIDYLQKIRGESADPQHFFSPLPRFQYGFAFIEGIAQRQMLLFPMKRLLQALDDYLRARQLNCHTLHWQLFDAHQVQVEFSIALSRSQNHWNNLLELSRIKLEQIVLANPIFSINLFCEDFFESTPAAHQLFPDAGDQREAADSLIDRLNAKLGKDALQRISIQESYWPEYAWSSAEQGTAANSVCNGARPLWLLPVPKQLTQRNNQPLWPTPLTLLRGPERIGNHWWQEEECERDYYIARSESWGICWVFYERKIQHWFLHGLFA